MNISWSLVDIVSISSSICWTVLVNIRSESFNIKQLNSFSCFIRDIFTLIINIFYNWCRSMLIFIIIPTIITSLCFNYYWLIRIHWRIVTIVNCFCYIIRVFKFSVCHRKVWWNCSWNVIWDYRGSWSKRWSWLICWWIVIARNIIIVT